MQFYHDLPEMCSCSGAEVTSEEVSITGNFCDDISQSAIVKNQTQKKKTKWEVQLVHKKLQHFMRLIGRNSFYETGHTAPF